MRIVFVLIGIMMQLGFAQLPVFEDDVTLPTEGLLQRLLWDGESVEDDSLLIDKTGSSSRDVERGRGYHFWERWVVLDTLMINDDNFTVTYHVYPPPILDNGHHFGGTAFGTASGIACSPYLGVYRFRMNTDVSTIVTAIDTSYMPSYSWSFCSLSGGLSNTPVLRAYTVSEYGTANNTINTVPGSRIDWGGSPFLFGTRGNSVGLYCNAYMFDIRIYNVTKTVDQLDSIRLYTAMRHGEYSFADTNGLVWASMLDMNAGDSVYAWGGSWKDSVYSIINYVDSTSWINQNIFSYQNIFGYGRTDSIYYPLRTDGSVYNGTEHSGRVKYNAVLRDGTFDGERWTAGKVVMPEVPALIQADKDYLQWFDSNGNAKEVPVDSMFSNRGDQLFADSTAAGYKNLLMYTQPVEGKYLQSIKEYLGLE